MTQVTYRANITLEYTIELNYVARDIEERSKRYNHTKKAFKSLKAFLVINRFWKIELRVSHYLISINFCICEIGVNPSPDAVR